MSIDKSLLSAARRASKTTGVTRAIPITRFDAIGIPVWSVTRPRSKHLIVTGGKGFTDDEAEISARLESLEQFAAEQPVPEAHIHHDTINNKTRVDDEYSLYTRIYDGTRENPLLKQICWVPVLPLHGVEVKYAPLERVVHPGDHTRPSLVGQTTTAGLACGSDLQAAATHGLAEVIERHIASLVRLGECAPEPVNAPAGDEGIFRINEGIRGAGLIVRLRYTNWNSVHFFESRIFDPRRRQARYVNGGYGASPSLVDAARSAMLEAVQSRCVTIHGSRDDLPQKDPAFQRSSRDTLRFLETWLADTPRNVSEQHARQGHQDVLERAVAAANLGGPYVYIFPRSEPGIATVRVIVPGAENLSSSHSVMGPTVQRRMEHMLGRRICV